LPGVPEDRSVTQIHNNTPRTPGLKTLGFFVFEQKVMIETDSKKQREAEFTQKYTLTPEDLRKMILEKAERARVYSLAVRKREIAHE
jgi:hypothetical protein